MAVTGMTDMIDFTPTLGGWDLTMTLEPVKGEGPILKPETTEQSLT